MTNFKKKRAPRRGAGQGLYGEKLAQHQKNKGYRHNVKHNLSVDEPEPEGCGCDTYDDFTCAEHQAYHEEMEDWMNG